MTDHDITFEIDDEGRFRITHDPHLEDDYDAICRDLPTQELILIQCDCANGCPLCTPTTPDEN